jgi:outer membrane protein OmpA-like peptidoglycan-associated protein
LRHKGDSVIADAKAGPVTHEPYVIEKTVLHFNFEFNSSDLDDASRKYLNDLSVALNENMHMKVKLTGHTDNVGSPGFNMRLSFYRANVVAQYLIEKGVRPSRIETQGKGLTEPLNENRSEAERALNRRVELLIYYQE